MRVGSHGLLGTLLFAATLLAIPLMAVFGIPEFAPAIGPDDPLAESIRRSSDAPVFDSTPTGRVSSDVELGSSVAAASTEIPAVFAVAAAPHSAAEAAPVGRNEFAGQPEPGRRRPVAGSASPAVRPASLERGTPRPYSSRTTVNPASSLAGTTNAATGAVADSLRAGLSAGATTSRQPRVAETLTWRRAVQRLNQMGIREYRLEPGLSPDRFLFVCFYTPRENPRITHRFEAEASEPLRAVAKVLAQIESWRLRNASRRIP